MPYRVNHIHLKSPDPDRAAAWYVRAFNVRIQSSSIRPAPFSDRFVRCVSEDGGLAINISGALTGQSLGPGDAQPHHGLEHFGFDSENLDEDIARLRGLGAELLDGPIEAGPGTRIAFIKAPDDVRIELIERRDG
jgi:catechol 2,3-dioxygenase-like lactoylglutathione lyase family enzyme